MPTDIHLEFRFGKSFAIFNFKAHFNSAKKGKDAYMKGLVVHTNGLYLKNLE